MTSLAGVPGERAAMVAPLWRGVDRVVLVCDGAGVASDARLCALALAEARRDSPIAVSGGDPAGTPRRQDAIVRMWIAATGAASGGLTLMATMRRGVVVDDSEGASGDGLLARSVALSGSEDAALSAGVAGALDRVLPWRRWNNGKSVRSRRP